MRKTFVMLFFVSMTSCDLGPVAQRDPDLSKPPVTISPWGEFRGGYNTTRRGRTFETYRGIPYAEPPVGELRFQPPQLILQYKKPVDAIKDGSGCPRRARVGAAMDEDCLFLNIYTPLKSDRKGLLPVVFYIHAGGFYSMTGRSDLIGPHYLLDKDLVLVTINYRLGTLGFLSTGDQLAPGNNGFKDQVIALRWVQQNIVAFGGDPNSVTITGCSSGSKSVMLHMISPMSKGLFHKAISMSGSPISIRSIPDNLYHLAVKQAELLNCPTNTSEAIFNCLKNKHWEDIGNSLLGFFEFGYDPLTIWTQVVEKDFGQERFLTVDPVIAIQEGKLHAVPFIISQTRDEFFWKAYTVIRNDTLREKMNAEWATIAPISFLLPRENTARVTEALRAAYLHDRPLKTDEESANNLGLLYQDSLESFPIYRLVNLMSRHSPQPVWYYEFAYIGNHSHYEDPVTKKPIGVAHHDDLIYLFSLSDRFPAVGTSGSDSIIVDTMTDIWHNFAKYGDPNLGKLGVQWPRVTAHNRRYLRVDRALSVRSNLKEDRIKIWKEIYPLSY